MNNGSAQINHSAARRPGSDEEKGFLVRSRKSEVLGAHGTVPRARSIEHRLLIGSLLAGTAFVLVTLDALLRHRSDVDYRLIRAIQGFDLPYLEQALRLFDTMTGSFWAITLWASLLIFFALIRRSWLPAIAVAFVPLAGGLNWIVGQIVNRPRPEGDQLTRATDGIHATAFPSGHVVGAVMFYGLIFILAGRIRSPAAQATVRAGAVAVIILSGFGRVWFGAHWVSDVAAAYALGFALLLALAWAYYRLEKVAGDLPFVHAVPLLHDQSIPSTHALTSTILFEGDTVTKIYSPGFVPRAAYWLSFQAPFPYVENRDALDAAVHRRNLAAKLTEYWYGTSRVARALGVVERDGRLGLKSERIALSGEQDSATEKEFLFELCNRFDEAGLPTWQIDPRQPRGKDNALRGEDGNYYIVDLESGLVSPLASPRALKRAIRRADVPLFDTVYFDITRSYIEREAAAMRTTMGDAWYRDLLELVEQAASANARWHAGEPRIWSRLLRGIQTGFGLRRLPSRIRQVTRSSRAHAEELMQDMIEEWEADKRISSAEALAVNQTLAEPQIHRVLPHFGVHLAIGIATRFPVGSILRASYTAFNMLLATIRFLLRKIDRAEWRQLSAIHSPLVVVVAAMPGVGTFSYLLSGPIRSHHTLMRIVADSMLLKIPGRLYERFGWRALVALPAGGATDAAAPAAATGLLTSRRNRRAVLAVGIAGVGLIAVNLALRLINRAFAPSADWWSDTLNVFSVDSAGSLPTDYALILLAVTGILAVTAGLLLSLRQGFSILPWGMLTLLVVVFAVEEHLPAPASVVRRLAEFDRAEAGLAGWLWIMGVLLVFVTAGIFGYRFAAALPPSLRGMVMLGVVLFLGGAVGLEIVGWLYRQIFDASDFRYQIITIAEELAEFLGILMLLYVTLELSRVQIDNIPGEEVTP